MNQLRREIKKQKRRIKMVTIAYFFVSSSRYLMFAIIVVCFHRLFINADYVYLVYAVILAVLMSGLDCILSGFECLHRGKK